MLRDHACTPCHTCPPAMHTPLGHAHPPGTHAIWAHMPPTMHIPPVDRQTPVKKNPSQTSSSFIAVKPIVIGTVNSLLTVHDSKCDIKFNPREVRLNSSAIRLNSCKVRLKTHKISNFQSFSCFSMFNQIPHGLNFIKQECIPVRCICWWGLPGDVCPGGCLPRGCLPWGGVCPGVSAQEGSLADSPCEQNDRQV